MRVKSRLVATKKPPRAGRVKIEMSFGESLRRAMQVKPPREGWAATDHTGELPKSQRKRAAG